MRYCDNCHLEYPDTEKYCSKCGGELSHRPALVDRQRVMTVLKSLPGYKKILQNCTMHCDDDIVHFDYLMIHEAGVFAFRISESYRFIEGNDRRRYWTVADLTGKGGSYALERPVAQLEKDHHILDRLLRRFTFAKSFAYLLYPDDCGLERIVSQHLDQMLTLPRMTAILLKDIDRYGHAYDKAQIDKLGAMFKNTVNAETASRRIEPAFDSTQTEQRRRHRIFAILSLLCAVALALFFTVYHGHFSPPSIPQMTARPVLSQSVPGVDYTLSPACSAVFASVDQASLDKAAARCGFHSITWQPDASLCFSMDDGRQSAVLSAMSRDINDTFDRLLAQKAMPHITSVRTDDSTQLKLFVTSASLTETESAAVAEVLRYGLVCALLENRSPDEVTVSVLGQSGETIRKISAADFMQS